MKRFPQVAFLVFVLFFAACGRRVSIPRPDIPITKEQLKKTKDYYFKEIEKLKEETDKKEFQVLQKRGGGYNTSDSELKIKEARDLLGKLFDDVLREKFEEIDKEGNRITINDQLKVVGQKLKEAIELLKYAPEFGEKAKKEKGLFVKTGYSGDQAAVYQGMGEPDYKITSQSLSIGIPVTDSQLRSSRCFNPMRNEIVLSGPPRAEIWVYEGRWVIIFVSDFNGLDELISRQDISPQRIFIILERLCNFGSSSGAFRQISAFQGRNPLSRADEVIEYLFSRRGFRIPLGMEGLAEKAKTSAALPDLNFVSMVFSAKWFPLIVALEERLSKVDDLLRKSHAGFNKFFSDFDKIKESIIDDDLQKALTEFKEKNFRGPPEGEIEKIKTEIEEKHEREIGKAREELYKKFPKKTRKMIDSFWDITNWRVTLNPEKKHLEELLKLTQESDKAEIEKIQIAVNEFADTVRELLEEYKSVDLQLYPNIDKYYTRELGFKKPPTLFFLAEGVRYLPVTLESGLQVDKTDLTLKVRVRYKISDDIIKQLGLDPEKFIAESEIEVKPMNRTFKKYKDAQRLTPFGVFFPFELTPGRYEIQLELVDKNRENMIAIYSTSWEIRPGN